MSNSSLVDYKRISPNRTSPRSHKIDTITIHCVVGQLSVESIGGIFADKGRDASSNYGIGKDGRIGLYVEESDRSWCSSNAANDHRAVTIECASDTTDPYAVNSKVYAALLDLVTDICRRNGISRLVWSTSKSDRVNHRGGCNMTVHRDYAAKACPGDYLYSRMGQIAEEVNKRLGGGSSSAGSGVQVDDSKTDYAQSFVKSYAGQYTTTADLHLRAGAGTSKRSLVVMPKGTKARCYGYYTKQADGTVWLYVVATVGKTKYTGFASKRYLK